MEHSSTSDEDGWREGGRVEEVVERRERGEREGGGRE